nr:hypothetical protein [Actinomycetota bacterium]
MAKIAADMTFVEVASALDKGGHGYTPADAAVQLLVRHERWLYRQSFRNYIVVGDDGTAQIDWHLVHDLIGFREFVGGIASSSELKILAIACSLATNLPPKTSLR